MGNAPMDNTGALVRHNAEMGVRFDNVLTRKGDKR